MKHLKYFLIATLFFFTSIAFAQNNLEDVIYLKNGSVYRGLIIEQVPNLSYKIQIAGGSIISVTLTEIEKITKEPRYHSPVATEFHHEDNTAMGQHFFKHQRDTIPFYLKKHRPFTTIEFRPGMNNASIHLVHGYKFGRFGFVGIGIGLDAVSFSRGTSHGEHIFDNTQVNNGLYLPLFIHYSGEILRKRITPYYYLEAGYASHPTNPFMSNPNNSKSYGGPIAAAGFGVKFYSKSRASFALNMNVNWRGNGYRTNVTTTDVFGNPYTYIQKGSTQKLFGAIGLAIGF